MKSALAVLGKDAEEVFPIGYRSDIELEGGNIECTISGFLFRQGATDRYIGADGSASAATGRSVTMGLETGDPIGLKAAFLRELATKLPSWAKYLGPNLETADTVEVRPSNWNEAPFRIEFRFDTVTVFPLCNHGLDYIFTATREDYERRADLVFSKIVSDIADFVNGRTVVAVKRLRWLFFKAGWDVRFLPPSQANEARDAGASIIAWPQPDLA